MIEIKKFNGTMDTDSQEDFISPASHKYALNGRFFGTEEGLRFENIVGNTLIANGSLPSGLNECIGAYEDVQKQRIFFFGWNNNGANGIYVYDINAGTITPLIICLTNSSTDILNFDLNQPIVSVNIIYGDSQQGDILYWIDSLKRPTKLNVSRALGTITPSYGTFIRSYLDVIKEIPDIVPACAYEDDDTVTVNNVAGTLFRFKTRYYFDDNDKSATSSQSKIPLPVNETEPSIQGDQTKNAVIKIIVPTGAPNVYKIELLAAASLGNVFGDFFSVDILDKSDLSIPDNDIYIYKFYNNQIYAPIDINESNQLFDYVPIQANTQEVLMTNILIYGAIKENYNTIVPTATINIPSGQSSFVDTRLGFLVVQSGNTGFGSGNIHIGIVGQPITLSSDFDGNLILVEIALVDGSVIIYEHFYSSSIALTDVITGIISAATGLGFTIISSDTNNVIINKTNASLAYYRVVNSFVSPETLDSAPCYDFSNGETFAPIYFDADGRTSGIMVPANSNGISASTFPYSNADGVGTMPLIQLSISSQPPMEAHYFQLARLPNPTKTKLLYWITDRAYPGTDPTTGVDYVYLSIENLNQYIKNNPSTGTQLGYSWSSGDRIKIIENMVSATIFSTINDYSIINSINNPTINGLLYTGQFLQLLPPSNTAIVIDGIKQNFNFLIEIYTPTKSLSQNTNIFYEFGERYYIENPGTANRYHQGQIQNQTDSLPATFNFTEGDCYMRERTIDAGNILYYTLTPNTVINLDSAKVLPETFIETFTTTDYTPFNASLAVYNPNSTANNWLKGLVPGLSFTIKGVLNFQVNTPPSSASPFIIDLLENNGISGGAIVNVYELYESPNIISTGQLIDAEINFNYTVSFNPAYVAIVLNKSNPINPDMNLTLLGGYLSFVVNGTTYTVKIVDQNFSDFYPSAVNANGRIWAIQPNIEQTFTGTLVRYSLAYDIGTNINNVNRFYAQNYDQYDQGRGDIQRLKVRNRNMRTFQVRGVGNVPIFQNVLTNTTGQDNIGQSERVINNIQYYEGEFGMGYQYTSLVSGKIQDYFVDPVRGYQVRVSNDGMIPISELYKGQYYIRGLLTPYNDLSYKRQDGAIARILGYYDFFDETYVCILQGGTNSKSNVIQSYAFGFNEKRNAYSSFYSFTKTEFSVAAEENVYDFKNGNIYLRSPSNTNYCDFFGEQFSCQIQLVFNEKLLEKKTFESVNELSSDIFECPEIYTNIPSGAAGNFQSSKLIPQNFKRLEAQFSSAFLRDQNSIKGLINGDNLKGSYIVITFQKTDANKLVYLSMVSLRTLDSPLTAK